MQVAGDLVMRSYDFPMADEIADRIEKTIPANLRGDDDQQQIPPQVQQAMDQMQQQMQAMSAALETAHEEVQKLEADQQVKQAEVSIKQFDAETKRMALDKNQPQPEAPDNSALIAQQTAIEVAHINAQSAERLKMIEVAGQVMTASTSNEGDDETSEPDESSSALDMTLQALQQMVATMAAPKRLLRDESGRAYGVETVQGEM